MINKVSEQKILKPYSPEPSLQINESSDSIEIVLLIEIYSEKPYVRCGTPARIY